MVQPPTRPSAGLAKFTVPRIGRVFDRERLFAAMDGLADAPGLWICGPPGAGKTTLVATWALRRGAAPLWLQVDAGDADPATLAQSLDVLWQQSAAGPLELPAFGPDDLSDLSGWWRRRLNLWLAQRPLPWTLVFDNHQELPADSPLQDALAQTLLGLPRGVQWVFISREHPPAAFAAVLARQQLALIDAAPLRFDETETRLLARLHGRPEATAALAAAQGWAAGMTLMLLGSPSEAALQSPQASSRLFDYFAGEVLSRMPAEDQRALGAIAFLPSATPEMAAALCGPAGGPAGVKVGGHASGHASGYADAPALLERLAASSLFTDRRGGPQPVYVFHALFSDFLRRHAERTLAPAALQALQLRAGQLLADRGDVDAALQCWADAACWPEFQACLLLAASRYVAEGRTQALRQRIDALPVALRARLAYWRGFCALDSDPAAALADLSAAFDAAVHAADVQGQLLAAAGAATALVHQGRLHALDRWIDVLTQHAAQASQTSLTADEATEMRLVPGLLAALVYRAPWHPLAEPLAERAERLLHQGSALGQRLLLGSLAYHLLWRGHVDRLERIVLRIDALCALRRSAPVTLLRWWGVGIVVKSLLGQHVAAIADAQQALQLVETEPSLAGQRAATENLMVLAALAARDAVLIQRHSQRAAQSLHPDNAVDRTMYEHHRGMQALLEGDSSTALRLMRASVVSARAGGFPMREHIALIAHALAAAHHGEHDEAARVLEEVFAHPFFALDGWHHWVAGTVAAYAALCRGDESGALARLAPALAVARDCGFRHGPMLYCCGDMIARLAALALRHGLEPDIARSIVLVNDLPAPPQADATWPWALRVRALGGLQVEHAGAAPPPARKESRRLLELLRLLAAHGSTPLAQDTVADTLWPDAEGDAARNALDNALHRLRKLLGGDDRILLRQGALGLNPARCWTDVGELERLLSRLVDTPLHALQARVHELARLYAAPLLPEDDTPLVAGRRRALHAQVQRALRHAAERLQAAGHAAAAREATESLRDL